MPSAEVNGINMSYEITGSGPPLFQIHGLGLGHANFAALSPLLTHELEIVDFDLRGYGASDKPAERYDLDIWADDVLELMTVLGYETAFVHGTSMGGMVALALAAKAPERMRGLIVTGAMARYDRAASLNKVIWRRLVEEFGMGEEIADLIAIQALTRDYLDSDEGLRTLETMRASLADVDPETFLRGCHIVEEADVSRDLEKITCPALVIAGELDVMTPIDAGPTGAGARQIAERIPGGILEVIPRAGHYVLVENADSCARMMVQFVKGLDGKG